MPRPTPASRADGQHGTMMKVASLFHRADVIKRSLNEFKANAARRTQPLRVPSHRTALYARRKVFRATCLAHAADTLRIVRILGLRRPCPAHCADLPHPLGDAYFIGSLWTALLLRPRSMRRRRRMVPRGSANSLVPPFLASCNTRPRDVHVPHRTAGGVMDA